MADNPSEAYCITLTVSILNCTDVEDIAGSLFSFCVAFPPAVTTPLKPQWQDNGCTVSCHYTIEDKAESNKILNYSK